MKSARVVVLHCGARCLAVAVIRREKDRLCADRLETKPVPGPRLIGREWGEAMASLVSETLDRLPSIPVVLVLSPQVTLLKSLKVPRIRSAAKRRRVIAFEAMQKLPVALDALTWSTMPVGRAAEGDELLLAAVRNEAIDPLAALFLERKTEVRMTLPAASALLARIRMRTASAGSRFVVSVTRETVSFLQPDGDRCGVRVVALPRSAQDASRGSEGPDIAEWIANEALRSVMSFARTLKLRALDRCEVIAEANDVAAVNAALRAKLEVGVEVSDSGAQIAWSAAVDRERVGAAELHEIEGAAWAAITRSRAVIDLTPTSLRRAEISRKRRPWLAGALIAALIAPLPFLVLQQRASRVLEREVEELESTLRPLRAADAVRRLEIETVERGEAELKRRLALHERRTAWAEFLADLERRCAAVDGLWVERLMPAVDNKTTTLRLELLVCLAPPANATADTAQLLRQVEQIKGSFGESPFVGQVEVHKVSTSPTGVLEIAVVLENAGGRLL